MCDNRLGMLHAPRHEDAIAIARAVY